MNIYRYLNNNQIVNYFRNSTQDDNFLVDTVLESTHIQGYVQDLSYISTQNPFSTTSLAKFIMIIMIMLMLLFFAISVYLCLNFPDAPIKKIFDKTKNIHNLNGNTYISVVPAFRDGAVKQSLQSISLLKLKLPEYSEDENDLIVDLVMIDKVIVIPKNIQQTLKMVA